MAFLTTIIARNIRPLIRKPFRNYCSVVDKAETNNTESDDVTEDTETSPVTKVNRDRNIQSRLSLTGERSVNKLSLMGRIGNDPEIRGSEHNPITSFSLATSNSIMDRNGRYRQITDWHRVSVFREKLQTWAASTLQKGDRVYVTGPMKYGKYPNNDTGTITRTAYVNADEIILLEKKRSKFIADQNEEFEEERE